MRRSKRRVVGRVYLAVYLLLAVHILREYCFNSLADLRALWRPFSLDETRQCLLDSRGGQDLLAEADSAGLRFVFGEAAIGGAGNRLVAVRERRLPLSEVGEYRLRDREIVLTSHPIMARLMGCDERAAALAHEMQHALDFAGGHAYDRQGELRAFQRARAVRDNLSFENATLSTAKRFEIQIVYDVYEFFGD